MYPLYNLSKRHLLCYFRDRAAVFFSLLSVLIVLLLMLVFLGDMNKHELIQLIQSVHGTITDNDAGHLIIMWTIAGLLVVNAFTVPITMIGMYVQDKEEHKLESFCSSPVSRMSLITSYLISAIISGFLMGNILLLLSCCYVLFTGNSFLSISQLFQVELLLLLCVVVSSSMIMVIAQFVKSDHAWGSFSTLAGTLIGFLGGIYLPMGMLPAGIQSFLKCLPFLHETAMMRDIFTSDAVHTAFLNLPAEVQDGYQEAMGIVVTIQDGILSSHLQILGLSLCAIIMLSISIMLLKKHTAFDK